MKQKVNYSLLIIVFSILTNICLAQNLKPNKAEKKWAMLHPFAALRVQGISKKAKLIYRDTSITKYLDHYEAGGKLDAIRHVFFMASFAQKIKIKKIRELGVMHEKQNYQDFLNGHLEFGELPDSLSSVMDLRNNELGLMIGKTNKSLNQMALAKIVVKAILDGKATIVKRDSLKNYLTCNNEIIHLPLYQKQWYVPKCLVKSNED